MEGADGWTTLSNSHRRKRGFFCEERRPRRPRHAVQHETQAHARAEDRSNPARKKTQYGYFMTRGQWLTRTSGCCDKNNNQKHNQFIVGKPNADVRGNGNECAPSCSMHDRHGNREQRRCSATAYFSRQNRRALVGHTLRRSTPSYLLKRGR